MKKYVVMDIQNGRAIVLTDGGEFKNIKDEHYRKGQVINMTRHNIITGIVASAAACVLLAGAAIGSYNMPYSYVSIDVNPSIELELNCYNKIIDVVKINDDAAEILSGVNFKHMNVSEAVQVATNAIVENGFVPEKDGGVVVAVSSKDKKTAEKLVTDTKETVDKVVEENLGKDNEVKVDASTVDKDKVDEAHKNDVTPGKLTLIEKLAGAMGETVSPEFITEWKDKAVKDIMAAEKLEGELTGKLDEQITKMNELKEKLKNLENADEKALDELDDEIDAIEDEIEDILENSEALTEDEKENLEEQFEEILDIYDDIVDEKEDALEEDEDDDDEDEDEDDDDDEEDAVKPEDDKTNSEITTTPDDKKDTSSEDKNNNDIDDDDDEEDDDEEDDDEDDDDDDDDDDEDEDDDDDEEDDD